jgi:pimeloyl-ACP methyl ester carboxylesterase
MAADQIALHVALGGDDQAILIAHDRGAVGAWGATGQEPGRWRRCIILNIPPFAIFSENIVTYDQIKRWFSGTLRAVTHRTRRSLQGQACAASPLQNDAR